MFYPYMDIEGKFLRGVPEAFPKESAIKIVFARMLGQIFQRGHTS